MTFLRLLVAVLLAVSAIDLSMMIPGGFVETRDFSAYSPLTLGAFNIFLTALGLGSLVLTYVVAWHNRYYGLAALAGLGFVAVYLLDLGKLFPITPDPMSSLLATLEWIGTGVGGVLALTSLLALRREEAESGALVRVPISLPIILVLGVIALFIIAFATLSAMGR